MTNDTPANPAAELVYLRQQVAALEQQLAARAARDERDATIQLEQTLSLVEAAFEATADGILVVRGDGQVMRFNQRFLDLWHIPEDVAAAAMDDTKRLQAYVREQLRAPQEFTAKVQALYKQAEAESFDVLHFKDGRVFERYSRPQRVGATIVGRVWSFRDVTARVAAEQEHTHMQAQVIAMQSAVLLELSTPLIPISDQIVVMPLVGTVDAHRARQITETLLSGISTHRFQLAILDITGVAVVDTHVANTVLQCAQAVRLLGAQVVLTGIRPEVAQLLVGLGLDLSGVVTRSTLQTGIAYALGRS